MCNFATWRVYIYISLLFCNNNSQLLETEANGSGIVNCHGYKFIPLFLSSQLFLSTWKRIDYNTLRVTIKDPLFYYQNQECKVYFVKSIESIIHGI